MTPSTPRSARKKGRKNISRDRKHRIRKISSPKSPRSTLAQARRTTSGRTGKRRADGGGTGVGTTSGRSKLVRAAGHNRTKFDQRRTSPRSWKYSKRTMNLISTEPYEKNCLQREPIPDTYVFVPRGDVYITRNCRSKTKETRRLVYKVYDNAGKTPLGIRVPSDIYNAVVQSAAETADSRANAVKVRDEKDLARSRQLLRTQFPLMPAESLDKVLNHAFLKGSGRVGRTSTKTDGRKAVLAVEAHIRHAHTPYESLLKSGKGRDEARKAVWGMVQTIRSAWEAHGTQPMGLLAVRNRMGD
ncbi:hypothetical protein P175DRAFT_0453741 [Aspergillus ochraceoroseus IBT 24754]|uniref:DUF2293 domain-containing protein n=2 Tax=Aspergillus ochraceoroseus TaxID=138278 RepID=A0A2T5M2P4_9EURO|nr:uncharacterized protein P175DRAFT_0453741 [Aspergillus ochraceoroseus IBT 24754]KKK19072.1 hypothetical protein AOCH_007603 [Aspergillus ochraceoroseus]PTU22797.1 hypothetical protein P175DRAFT_0453741 [Aspergillus ochraceoroseus IBT 24754]